MLDFFSIFSKGGILLFCFKGMGLDEKDWESFVRTVNSLNKTVFLQVRKVFQIIKNSYISSAIQSLQIMYIPCVWLMIFKLKHLVILSEFGYVLKLFGKILITSRRTFLLETSCLMNYDAILHHRCQTFDICK